MSLLPSRLIGQQFSDPTYFWGWPSATSRRSYNGLASGGSHLGTFNAALLDAVNANVNLLQDADPRDAKPIAIELVTVSGISLDPNISWAAADYQASRVGRVRPILLSAIKSLARQHETRSFMGNVGDPTANVLELNLTLELLH
jgi:potassium-transporting ATPase KdpC subunit